MAQEVEIAGVVFDDVPYIQCPDSNRIFHKFMDTTIALNPASASDIATGKAAYVNDLLIVGTGLNGLEYELGTWTPANDIANHVIPFANNHDIAPFCYMVCDAKDSYSNTQQSNYGVFYYNFHQITGIRWYASSSSYRYGMLYFQYRTTSTTSTTTSNQGLTTPYTSSSATQATNSRYWATETGIRAYSGSTSRYWRPDRTYKWLAIWPPK